MAKEKKKNMTTIMLVIRPVVYHFIIKTKIMLKHNLKILKLSNLLEEVRLVKFI